MSYQIITDPNSLDRAKWDMFVENHPHGNVFQSSQMFYALSKTAYNKPVLICLMGQNNEILALLVSVIQKQHKGIAGYFSSRSIVHGGPLIKGDDDQVLKAILKAYLKHIKSKVIYSQFRNMWLQDYEKKIYRELGIIWEDHLNILVDLSKSEEELWKDVHTKRRNEIRRAQKEGTTFRTIENIGELEEAYNILKEVYKRVKVPLPSYSVFHTLYEEMMKNNTMQCFVAINKEKIIGTLIGFSFNGIVFDWYAGAYRVHYKQYPNDLIPWKVFLWGQEHGFKTFDFGGAGKPDEKYGVRDYKKKFGGELFNLGRYEIIHKKRLMMFSKFVYTVIKKI